MEARRALSVMGSLVAFTFLKVNALLPSTGYTLRISTAIELQLSSSDASAACQNRGILFVA